MILGQCGYFGFAALIGLLYLLIRKIFLLRGHRSDFASALFLILYLLISSTSESAFANPVAVPMAFWIGFLLAQYWNDDSLLPAAEARRRKRIRTRRQRRMRRRENRFAKKI